MPVGHLVAYSDTSTFCDDVSPWKYPVSSPKPEEVVLQITDLSLRPAILMSTLPLRVAEDSGFMHWGL